MRSAHVVFLCALLLSLCGCKLTKHAVDSVQTLPYPDWAAAAWKDDSLTPIRRSLHRAGDVGRAAFERFEIRRTTAGIVARAHVENAFSAVDIDVVADDHFVPLRVWRRATAPGIVNDARPDLRLFELRVTPATMAHRGSDFTRDFARMEGQRPTALVTESVGLATLWLLRAHLSPATKSRESVLDFAKGGIYQPGALTREADLVRPELGGRVRVYKIYGREVIFADDNDTVLGNLDGLVSFDETRGVPANWAQFHAEENP